MRVFVAGATGAIGRPLIPRLVAAGHEVTGMTRSEQRADEIAAAGAKAVVCDVFDAERLTGLVREAQPEAVVNQLTALPERLDLGRKDVYDATNRVRTEGTANLVAAMRAAGARRLVAQSISFVYEPEGDWVKDETAPVMRSAPGPFGGALRALFGLERQVLEAPGIEGLVLRYGFFYGPETTYAPDGYQAGEVRKRRFPVVGPGSGTFSFVHVEDAAGATVLALERGAPGIYNVVDDEPAALREWLPVYAEALGAKRPFRVPVWIAKLVGGAAVASMAVTVRGASNAKAKRELGWEPAYPSWRRGFREALG
jgi:nucleoside-diphosphate-sugar epimerase